MRSAILLLCALSWSGIAMGAETNKYILSADQLYSEYDSNEVAADDRYKGKQVTVTGIVQDIANDILGHPYIVIGSGVLQGVQCSFPDSRKSSVMRLTKGQQVTIKGRVQGKMILVQLNNAKLSENVLTVNEPHQAADNKSKTTQQEETSCYMLGLIYTVIGANRDAGRDIGTALYEVRNIDEWDNDVKRIIAGQMYNNPKFKNIDGGSLGDHMKRTCLKHPAFIDFTDPNSP